MDGRQLKSAIEAALGAEYSTKLWAKGGFVHVYLYKHDQARRRELGFFGVTAGVLGFTGNDDGSLAKVVAYLARERLG